jgi:hypothetical protein
LISKPNSTDGTWWLAVGYDDEPAYEERDLVAEAMFLPNRYSSGSWAVTRHSYSPTVQILSDRAISPDDAARIRNLVADFLDMESWSPLPEYTALMRQGVDRVERIVWSGYLHNAISSLIAMALVASLGWIVDRYRSNRNALRLFRGLCPMCAYDLRCNTTTGCPECGWRRGEARAQDH